MLFVLIGLPFLALALWPVLIEHASALTGIEQKTVMILCVAVVLLLMVFELLTIVSVQERRIGVLAQHVAILMQKMESALPHTATGEAAASVSREVKS